MEIIFMSENRAHTGGKMLLSSVTENSWKFGFIIWPVRPRARFHFKTIEKIPVWGPCAMARAGPEKAIRPCQDRVRPC